MALRPPPPADTAEVADTAPEEPEGPPPLELGPVLYEVRREASGAWILPVAEIAPDGLRPLPPEDTPDFGPRFRRDRAHPGARFTLFAAGTRVGTFHAGDEAVRDTTLCAPRLRIRGSVELRPEAVGAGPFLAVEARRAEGIPLGEYRPPQETRDLRVISLNEAAGLFNRLEALWPASLPGSRADLEIFRPGAPGDSVAIAATFLFQDELGIGSGSPRAWSLFYIAEPRPTGWEPTFYWYRIAAEEGRGIPVFAGHMDWDRDGAEDVLLEVLGAERRWYAAVVRSDSGWERTFEEPCGRRGGSGPDVAGP